ncbi:hypothetical protein Ddye_013967, partial [Dipteronia dyeriana]
CFAQNLVASINMWENIFTISITISIVVLFVFLLRNMQDFIFAKRNYKIKGDEIEGEGDRAMDNLQKAPENLWWQVKKYQQHVWRETKGVDVEKLLNNLPKDLRKNI